MRLKLAFLALSSLVLLLGCAGVGRGFLHPPQVRLQEVAESEEGLTIALRVLNQAARAARFDQLEVRLSLDGAAPVSLVESVPRELPARSVEIYRFTLSPGPTKRPTAEPRSALFWRLEGRVRVEGQNFPVAAEGRLDPVPGRPGVFR